MGPKRYDVPWKELEAGGWIATAWCHEIRLDMPEDMKVSYAIADKRQKFRMAAENPDKPELVKKILEKHKEDSTLIIGQYVNQLKTLAKILKAPLITGQTPNREREVIYEDFRQGRSRIIVVSKVANFAIDLPTHRWPYRYRNLRIPAGRSPETGTDPAPQRERLLVLLPCQPLHTWRNSMLRTARKFLTEQGYQYTISLGLEEL